MRARVLLLGALPLVARAGEAAPAAELVAGVRLGQRPARVVRAAEEAGAEVQRLSGTTPGALAEGLMARPDLLALLHDNGVQPVGLDDSAAEATVVVAELEGARAAYWFAEDRLAALALALPQRAVAPRADPFDPDRLRPLWDTLAAACPRATAVQARDRRGNAVAWTGPCAGGRAAVAVDARQRDAAVRVVVWDAKSPALP